MGAFNGYIRGGCPSPSSKYEHFKTQSSFNFHKEFGISELKYLLAEAEATNEDTIFVPHERPGWGSIGLSTWYVRALVNQIEKEKSNANAI